MEKTKPKEKLLSIKKCRSSMGYFTNNDMAKMFADHDLQMTRQTYSNKETGRRGSKFTVKEIQILAEVFGMDLAETIHLFNDWD